MECTVMLWSIVRTALNVLKYQGRAERVTTIKANSSGEYFRLSE